MPLTRSQRQPALRRSGRQHRLASSEAGRVERRAEHGEGDQPAGGQVADGIDDRDRRYRDTGQDVGADRGSTAPDDVDDGAGEDTGDEERDQRRCGDDTDQGRAPRALEHEPRQDNERDAIADAGEQRASLEQQNRAAVPPG